MKKQEIRSRIKLILAVICVFAAGICYIGSRHAGGGASGQGAGLVIGGEPAGGGNGGVGEEEEAEGEGRSETAGEAPAESPGTEPPGGSRDRGAPGSGVPGEESGEAENAAGDSEREEAVIYVHVCGEVKIPGVYEMPAGSRVYEAVEMAGGCTENGAADYLNMAQEVTDGMKIQVPDREEARRLLESQPGLGAGISGGASGVSGQAAGDMQAGGQAKVNINTASEEELMTLTGIGEARAGDIIRYREEHGGFKRIEDIMKVSGIKEAAFQKIKDSITV